MPLVSVLMPAYNAEKYIIEAIESILKQSFTDFELIIINDCSQDSTSQLLTNYALKDSRIVIINNDRNLGVSDSLNKGLEIAQGKYIARMDADDIADKKRFEVQVAYMDAHPDTVLCGSSIEFINESGKALGYRNYPTGNDVLKKQLPISNPFAHPTVLINRSLLNNFKLKYSKDYPRCEDYHLWFQIAQFGKFHNCSEPLLKYRLNPSALKSTACKAMLCDTIRLKKSQFRKYRSVKMLTRLFLEMCLYILPARTILFLFNTLIVHSHSKK